MLKITGLNITVEGNITLDQICNILAQEYKDGKMDGLLSYDFTQWITKQPISFILEGTEDKKTFSYIENYYNPEYHRAYTEIIDRDEIFHLTTKAIGKEEKIYDIDKRTDFKNKLLVDDFLRDLSIYSFEKKDDLIVCFATDNLGFFIELIKAKKNYKFAGMVYLIVTFEYTFYPYRLN